MSACSVLTETLGQAYRVALYRPVARPPIIIADPLAEMRSLAISAQVVWQRHLQGEPSCDWFEPVTVRRTPESWPDLFIHVVLTSNGAGAVTTMRWRRVTRQDVERTIGGRVGQEALPARAAWLKAL